MNVVETYGHLLKVALRAADPDAAVRKAVANCVVPRAKRTFCLAMGKAAPAMARGLAAAVRLDGGLVVAKVPGEVPDCCDLVLGDHPVPGARSLAAAASIEAFVRSLEPDDLLVVLLSGGASALVSAPVASLEDIARVTEGLLRGGADIHQLNTVRRALDRLKGGGLAGLTPCRALVFVLSDVVGDFLGDIGSGPFFPSPTSPADALGVLRRYGLGSDLEKVILGAAKKPVKDVEHVIVASAATTARAVVEAAVEIGMHARLASAEMAGEAREVGRFLGSALRDYRCAKPTCLVAAGETTVTVRGEGFGGRNLEVALGAVEPLDGCSNRLLVTFATDGEDGPTDAAGAVVDGDTASRGRALGLDVPGALADNDSYNYFEPLDALLKPGPTGTNVNDLVIMLAL